MLVDLLQHTVLQDSDAGVQRRPGFVHITLLQRPVVEVAYDLRPGAVALADSDDIGPLGHLVGYQCDMRAANDDGRALLLDPLSQHPGAVDEQRFGADADQVLRSQRVDGQGAQVLVPDLDRDVQRHQRGKPHQRVGLADAFAHHAAIASRLDEYYFSNCHKLLS